MDDLLALFDEVPPEQAPTQRASNPAIPTPHDDASSSKRKNEYEDPSTEQVKQKAKDIQSQAQKRLASVSSNVDAKVGFRITSRKVSSMDLLDMLSSHPYHSPASLAAMSLQQLNTLLCDPARPS